MQTKTIHFYNPVTYTATQCGIPWAEGITCCSDIGSVTCTECQHVLSTGK